MKQRVGLARALAVETGILLMDEAFSGARSADPRRDAGPAAGFATRLKRTIVFVTHDLDEAVRLGNRIVIMKDGAIVQTGTPDDILKHPADDYVARFVQIRNRD